MKYRELERILQEIEENNQITSKHYKDSSTRSLPAGVSTRTTPKLSLTLLLEKF